MAAGTVGNECAVLNGPCVGTFLGLFPAVKSFSVAKRGEAFLDLCSPGPDASRDKNRSEKTKQENAFHVPEIKARGLWRKEKPKESGLALREALQYSCRMMHEQDKVLGPGD